MAHDDPQDPHHHHHHHHKPSVPEQHKARGPSYARVYVITCSDSRTAANDEGGKAIKSMLADKGHVVAGGGIARDDPARMVDELRRAKDDGSQAVLITGGTGISSRDRTFDAVSAAIAKPLP